MSSIRLVAALGNPGEEYAKSRHNFGLMVVSYLLHRLKTKWSRSSRFKAKEAVSGSTYFIFPTTYMNASGPPIAKALKAYDLSLEQLLVVFDNGALPFGTIKIRAQGSSAGHNGLKSVEQALGTNFYKRLGLGIGAPHSLSWEKHVLSPFTLEEQAQLPKMIEGAGRVVEQLMVDPFERVMERVNRLRLVEKFVDSDCCAPCGLKPSPLHHLPRDEDETLS